MKGIDLSVLDVRDYIDINKLKREKMNEYERLFNHIENQDKVERLTLILNQYKEFSKNKKLKYVTIGKKNLMKLINSYYHEKFTENKEK